MPRIIMNPAFTARWTRMPHSTGRLSASASSHHSLSSAAFITNISESDFRHAQHRSRSAKARLGRWAYHGYRKPHPRNGAGNSGLVWSNYQVVWVQAALNETG